MTSAVSSIFGGGGGGSAPAPEREKERIKEPDPTNADIEARNAELALREQSLGQRAAAAGAMRSGNDADLLGYTRPKKRDAGRAILG